MSVVNNPKNLTAKTINITNDATIGNNLTITGDLSVDGDIYNPAGTLFYTTGTWTPALTGGTSGAFTMNEQIGNYTRVGNLCFVSINVTWTSRNTATGDVLINMPFAPDVTSGERAFVNCGYVNTVDTFSDNINLSWRSYSGSNFSLVESRDDAAGNHVDSSDVSNTGQFQMSGSYII